MKNISFLYENFSFLEMKFSICLNRNVLVVKVRSANHSVTPMLPLYGAMIQDNNNKD